MSKTLTDEQIPLYELLELLESQSGVTGLHVSVEVTATVQRTDTSEYDDYFQPIRERSISEDEMKTLIEGSNWRYSGTIDLIGDFYLKDRFRKQFTLEENDD